MPLGTRLSLYDTSGHSVSKRSLHPNFQRTPPGLNAQWLQTLCVCRSSREIIQVVGLGGLEPPTSPLSGVRSNHLSYRPKSLNPQPGEWWSQSGSNRRPPACKAGALPAELWPLWAHSLNAGHLCGRLAAWLPFVSKGGDPAAPSDTATLLRLHPSHESHRGNRPPEG